VSLNVQKLIVFKFFYERKLLNLGRVLDRNQLKQIKAGFMHPDDDDECGEHCHFYHNGLGYCYRC